MFRTELDPQPSSWTITHDSPTLTIGSCFSGCMGHRFEKNKFPVLSNPFGTVYNPISIFKLLGHAIDNSDPSESHFIETQDLWVHLDFHSKFSSTDKVALEQGTRHAIQNTHQFLKTAKYLVVTLGTALVYKSKTSGEIVANCHKIPAREFSKHLLTQKQVVEAFSGLLEKLTHFNTSLRLILTVSPVRHIKDSLEVNAVSKSLLRLVCDTLASQYAHVSYFPSYEIMMDDLRDYRFYATDMIHPSEQAEEYIWNKFASVYFNSETQALLKKWSSIQNALEHRPFNPSSGAHQKFIRQTIQRVQELSDKFDITRELDRLKKQLVS